MDDDLIKFNRWRWSFGCVCMDCGVWRMMDSSGSGIEIGVGVDISLG